MNELNWKIFENVDGYDIGYRAIVTEDGETICNPSPMGEANALLIAAAPDLLEALCTALPFVEDHEYSDIYKPEAIRRALAQIRAAIDRAVGEPAN